MVRGKLCEESGSGASGTDGRVVPRTRTTTMLKSTHFVLLDVFMLSAVWCKSYNLHIIFYRKC